MLFAAQSYRIIQRFLAFTHKSCINIAVRRRHHRAQAARGPAPPGAEDAGSRQLTGSIAHDFNNMMIILANADALEEDDELTEHGRRRVAQTAEAIARAVRVPENSTSITLWRGSK